MRLPWLSGSQPQPLLLRLLLLLLLTHFSLQPVVLPLLPLLLGQVNLPLQLLLLR